MSDLLQSGHPNADQLSAFAEQALPAHEYQETLAHLAVCPDCRTIVALSLPALEEAPRPVPVPVRKPWFSGWNLAWPAAAALAGLTVVVLYVQRTQFATNHESQSSQVAVLPEQPGRPVPPSPQLAVPSAVASSAAKSATHPPPGPLAATSQPPLITSQGVTDLPVTGRNTLDLPEMAKANHPATTGSPASAPRPNADAAFRLPADAKVLSPVPPPPAPDNEAVAAMDARPQPVQPTNAVVNAPLLSATAAQVTLQPATRLPSGLPTLSMTSEDHRVLALDTQHALFFSQDDGQHWEPVPTPWSGHAVKVNLATPRPPHGFMAARSSIGSSAGLIIGAAPSAGATQALPTPAITGIVTDPTGATIPGVTVLLSNTQTQKAITLKTDANGRYLATSLPPGTYQLEAESPGFEKRLLSGLTLAPNQTLQSDLTLEVGASTETVMVTADQVEVDASRAGEAAGKKARRSSRKAAVTPSSPVFEILTDTGARWTSSDGQHWQTAPK